jgi:transcriptional accessory protein Tex/SPT6
MAQKICHDALEDDADLAKELEENPKLKNDKFYEVRVIMKRPQALDDLRIEEYAEHLATAKKRENFIHTLRFIIEELTIPFRDPRAKQEEMPNEELFYKLARESPATFHRHSIVTGQVEKKPNGRLIVKILSNRLIGVVKKADIDVSQAENNETADSKAWGAGARGYQGRSAQ